MQYVTYLFKENGVLLLCSKLLLFSYTKVHRSMESLNGWGWKEHAK